MKVVKSTLIKTGYPNLDELLMSLRTYIEKEKTNGAVTSIKNSFHIVH